ncbi:hypothetical protein [Solitalea lacus]|uniref:hypothetical protein n=1 Tax=Solitalea lacus TaxID=2911172 RepID=UPI001EDADA08|nr:hypothetical protein [Solitalea lacus]UKJ09097.1 hypothetical protein L2B55_08000 [Solitalea lacus]
MKSKLFLVFFLLFNCFLHRTFAQTDSLPKPPSLKKLQFLAFPVIGISPVTKLEFGAGAILSYQLGDKTITRPSFLYSYNSYTVNKQTMINLLNNLYTEGNKWHAYANFSFIDYPVYFYGAGRLPDGQYPKINSNRKNLLAFVERKVTRNLFLGVGSMFQSTHFTDLSTEKPLANSDLEGKDGGNDIFLGGVVTYDTRDYENQTHKGYFVRLINVHTIGSGKYTTNQLTFDGRIFRQVTRNQYIGFQGYFSSVQGNTIPFYSLAQLGSANLMRGYYNGRYLGQNYSVLQSEYRYTPFSNRSDAGLFSLSRITVAGFAGVGNAFMNHQFEWKDIKPTYGFGARYMFNPKARMCLRVDFAWGNKPNGLPRESGTYFAFNEAF